MKIQENQIYCLIPFYLDTPLTDHPGGAWIPLEPKYDKDAMYPFMQTGSRINRVYGLNPEGDLRKFFQQTSVVADTDGGELELNMLNNAGSPWRGPRLVISRGGETGLLSLPVSLVCRSTEGTPLTGAQVCEFVNRLQKYDSGQAPVFSYRIKGNVHILQDRLDSALGLCRDGQPHTWTLGALIELLLGPLGERATMFKPYRCHILTYLLAEGSDAGTYSLTDEDRRLLLRITHCQNRRYHVTLDTANTSCLTRTFENIYTGVSVEGSCVLGVVQHSEGDRFLEAYGSGTFQTRFMWMYINAMMQRHSLLDMDRRIAALAEHLDSSDAEADRRFADSMRRICGMRLTGMFTSISAYSHINALYGFLLHNLGVEALYAELDEKLRAIDSWLKLVEARQNAEVMRMQQAEAAGREKFERFVQTGGVILAVMALLYGIPQAVTSLRDTCEQRLWVWSLICLLPAVAGMIWLIAAMLKSRK